MGLLRFLNNVRYMFRYDLKSMYISIENQLDDNDLIDHVLYEVGAKNLPRPNIRNIKETISDIKNNKASIARFGDGEVSIICGKGIPFQKYDKNLAEQLKAILSSGSDYEYNLYVGINSYSYYSDSTNFTDVAKRHFRGWIAKNRKVITAMLNGGGYHSAEFTQLYQVLLEYDFAEYFNTVREIWDGRKLLIVCGDRVFNNISYNIYDNGASIEYLYVPSINAYEHYDEIMEKIEAFNNDTMIILIAGPTATVMAASLAKKGYQALDLGHMAKDYNSYKLNEERTVESVLNFMRPD